MASIIHISVDLETYSSINLAKSGLYKYAQSPDFDILLISYSVNGGPVTVVDMFEDQQRDFPERNNFLYWLDNPRVVLHAFNAAFEWYCLCRYMDRIGWPYDAEALLRRFHCTMLHALYCGLPASLASVGTALGLPEDKRKLAAGKALIRYFCVPCKPSKTNGQRTRNLPQHDVEKWSLFKEYNQQDVVTEMEIERRLSNFPVPGEIQAQWVTDQIINARGVAVDMDMIEGALEISAAISQKLREEAIAITGLDNPNSRAQLLRWLEQELDEEVQDITKDTVATMLQRDLPSEKAVRMLQLRQEMGKTSTKKYNALELAAGTDNRVRGLLQFYGANRTGRWAGRIVQPQNLPRTYLEALPLARELVKNRSIDGLRIVYGGIPDTLSQLIRTAFVASPGNTLVDADFSAIEARVISWLAGEEWRLQVFRTHGKIYEASASQMFGVPLERIKKGNPEYALRQRGKVAELALGYQGGVSAMRRMDTGHQLDSLSDEEVKEIVYRWRGTNRRIQDLWYAVNGAAIEAVGTGRVCSVGCLTFARELDPSNDLDYLTIGLPSKRKLYYARPSIGTNRWGEPSVQYMGIDQSSRKWKQLETYGGKLVENCVQAIARDCLAEAIERLEAVGYHVVFHVHDEIIADCPESRADLDEVIRIMAQPVSWAPGLPLNADGWINPFFKKD